MSPGAPIELVQQIAQRNCALFLGPDAAESGGGYRGLPTSWQLAEELASLCGYRGGYRPLPQIAQIYQARSGRHSLISYLRERLDGICPPLPIHQLITRIPFGVIVHGGWDSLLERALDQRGFRYQTIYATIDLPYTRIPNGLLLYRPYGSLDRPETLVITEDDQLDNFNQLRGLKSRLTDLIMSRALFLVGYAPDYDSAFVRIYHEIREGLGEHRPPAYVIGSLGRPEDALQWEARGIRPLVADPITFLYDLAEGIAVTEGRPADLPALDDLSQAARVTPEDLAAQTMALYGVLEKLGVGDLIEQSELPLLGADQVSDLEAMRAAYERLSQSVAPTADVARVWLRQGNVEYTRQNYETARRYYEQALSLRPDLAEAYHNLHYVFMAQDDLDGALEAYEKAIALKSELAVLPGRYRIDRVLGRGGIGVVYRAVDQVTGQTVAVKLLDRAYLRTEQAIRRFRREAEILQRLDQPHIIRYVDFQPYQGRYYLVMEYLGDQTLAHLLAERGRLPLDQAADILEQVCQAVSFVHARQIIHRDIKPANIFLTDGGVKLIDFGLAVDLASGQPSVVGQATGTIAYMAPEQVIGGRVDERTDVYALATVAYEMITGRHPSQGAYRPPSELVPGLNDALDIVLEKAREQQPTQRYPNVEAFRQEFAHAVPLQPASQRARWWLQALSRFQQGIRRAVMSFWSVLLLFVAVIGAAYPNWLTLVGVTLWDIILLVFLADWFTTWQARRSGYPLLAANGSLLGFLLGLVIGLVTYFLPPYGNPVSSQFYLDYLTVLLIHGILAVITGGFGFLAIGLGMHLAIRLRLSPQARVAIALSLVVIVLLLYVLVLAANFGWS